MLEGNYTIVIRNESENRRAGQSVGGAGGIGNNGMTPTRPSQSSGGTGDSVTEKLLQKAKGYLSVAAIASVADRIVSHNLSLIEVHTGSRELQERTTHAYNFGKTIVGGATAGASLGTSIYPGLGTAIGAVVGAVVSTVGYGVDLAFQGATIYANKQLSDVQRNYTTQRATISGSRYMNATQM